MFFLIVALIGLVVGSFLNVVIGRLRSGERGWRSRSRCPECRTTLSPSELIPIVSFLFLRGRCRSCRKSISWHYPLVECSTMLLFLAAYALRAASIDITEPFTLLPVLRDWVFLSFLTIIFVVDLQDMVVFDSVSLSAAGFAFIANIALDNDPKNLLVGAAVGGGFFFLQYVLSRGRWIGGGDIRLGVMMGTMLGFPLVILALFAAYMIGACVALGLMAAGKATWNGQMAFGTFLGIATVLAMFFGHQAMEWYAGLLGF